MNVTTFDQWKLNYKFCGFIKLGLVSVLKLHCKKGFKGIVETCCNLPLISDTAFFSDSRIQ